MKAMDLEFDDHNNRIHWIDDRNIEWKSVYPICSVMASTVDCGSARLCSNHNLWIINTKTGQMVAMS